MPSSADAQLTTVIFERVFVDDIRSKGDTPDLKRWILISIHRLGVPASPVGN